MKNNLINTAKGLKPADLVIKNAKLVNVLSEEIYETDIAITDGIICGLGKEYAGKEEIDAHGYYVCPSFIDGHVHLESSMMLPSEFAKVVVPTGTTTVFTDPHEIANVMGLEGIQFMHEHSQNTDLDVYFMLPSCVPATPFENSGYILNTKDLETLMDENWVCGLAEMMNYVGVINQDSTVLNKIEMAQKHRKRIDGHAPMLSGKDLCAYLVSGIKSEHECTTIEEAVEKLRLGVHIMLREGSAAKNLDALLPLLKNYSTRKCMFATDDRHPTDLSEHINGMVKRAVEYGIDPIKAIQCSSLNTAEYFGIKNLGAIAPGYQADMLILKDLTSFVPYYVIKKGRVVAKDGHYMCRNENRHNDINTHSVNIAKLNLSDFQIQTETEKVKTIEVIPNQVLTKSIISEIKLDDNKNAISNTNTDTLKICVIERHHATGNIGKGFIKGFNLKSGALASTVAHDSHNMIIIGTNDEDMLLAAQRLEKSQGGQIVVENGKVLAQLELPIAGLMSSKPFEEVKQDYITIAQAAKKLGTTLEDAFMTMSFLSLPVIPELKITDKGLFDTNTFTFTDINK